MEDVAFGEKALNHLLKTEMGAGALIGGGQCSSRVWEQKSGDMSREQ